MRLLFFIGLLSILSFQTFSCDEHGITGIAPENDLWISPFVRNNAMDEAEFNRVLDRIESIYTPIFQSDFDRVLDVQRKWSNGTVNAYAKQEGRKWIISMFGGLARHPLASSDGFALVACHEIGHHIGGAPKRTMFWIPTWASNEGQSDYWGVQKCLRKYFAEDDNVAYMADKDVDPFVTNSCKKSFSDEEDIAICERASLAGLSLARVLGSLRSKGKLPNFNTPDNSKVRRTNSKHPAAQCRLDTYFQSALCDRGHDEPITNANHTTGFCSRKLGDKIGLRPLCWYKPRRF